MRKLLKIFVSIFLFSLYGYAQKTVEFVKSNGAHNVKITVKTKPFDPRAHKADIIEYLTIIDGKRALGTDGGVPRTEIESIRLVFDGKELSIPKSLFSDCYEPSFEKDFFKLKIGDDGKSVMVFMAGGDAAGSYQIFWVFRSDGKHSRFGSGASDAGDLDFINIFFDN